MLATPDALQGRAAALQAAEEEAADVPSVSDSVAAAFGGKLVLDRVPRGPPAAAAPERSRRHSADVRPSSGAAALSTSKPERRRASVDSRRDASRAEREGPLLYMGAAAEQGPRGHMEDRYSLQPFFQPEPPQTAGEADSAADGPAAEGIPPPLRAVMEGRVNCAYCGVFDGHSAAAAADVASLRMHRVLAQQLGGLAQAGAEGETDKDPITECISSAFSVVDFEIIAQANRDNESYGCTAVIALQLGATLYVAHAGDSEAVLDSGGKTVVLAEAARHKPDEARELKRIISKGGKVNRREQRIVSPTGQGALNMSRSLGDPAYKQPHRLVSCEPTVKRIELTRQDSVLILATDGLWDVMKPADAIAVVKRVLQHGGSVQLKAEALGDAATSLARTAAQVLVNRALELGSQDNVTAVVCVLRWA